MILSAKSHTTRRSLFILAFTAVACGLLTSSALAQATPKAAPAKEKSPIDIELDYADGLSALGLNDYAQVVIDRIVEPGARGVLIRIKSLCSQGKLPDALALIGKQPDQAGQAVWTMKLQVADYYYAFGNYTNAQAIYEAYFAKFPSGPTPELNDSYIESSYKYVKLLTMMGAEVKALAAYDNVLKANFSKEPGQKRQILAEQAELMIKLAEKGAPDKDALLKAAKKIAGDLMWVQDMWYGKAIVMLAHIKIIEGDFDGAQKMLNDKSTMDTLKGIEDALYQAGKERGEDLSGFSPVAEFVYLRGEILYNQAKKLLAANNKEQAKEYLIGKTGADGKATEGAYHVFVNVFVNYASTPWASEAGVRVRQIEALVSKEYDKKLRFTMKPEQMKKVEKAQFQMAKVYFNQQEWEKSITAFQGVLKLFPEGEQSVSAVADIAEAYIELNETNMADTVVHYLAERFAKHYNHEVSVRAGDELIKLAEKYGSRNELAKREECYQQFFDNFNRHPRTPSLLLNFGDRKFSAKDFEGAKNYYQMVVNSYSNSSVYFNALSRLSLAYDRLGQKEIAVKTLEDAIVILKQRDNPGQELVDLLYRLAFFYKQLGGKQLPEAYAKFDEVIKMLSLPQRKYERNATEAEANKVLLEGAIFWKSQCRAMMTEPEDKDKEKAYKQEAVEGLAAFIKQYPKSKFTPGALMQLGTLYGVLGNEEEAKKAFDRLKKDFKDAPETKMMSYNYAIILLKMGLREKAMVEFRKMFEGGDGVKYTDGQILTAGKELLEDKAYDLALMAFNKVLANAPKERSTLEQAMIGQGKALVESGKMDEGAKALELFFKTYSNSYYRVEASYAISKAYAELQMKEPDEAKRIDLYNKAVKALMKLKNWEPGARKMKVDLAIADLKMAKSKAEEGFAAAASDPKAKAQLQLKAKQYRDEVRAMLEQRVMLDEPKDPEAKAMMEEIYYRGIGMLVEDSSWDKVYQYSAKYLKNYPTARYAGKVREWRTKASSNVSAEDLKKGSFEIEEDTSTPTNGVAGAVSEPADGATNAAPGAAVAPDGGKVESAPAADAEKKDVKEAKDEKTEKAK